MIGDTISADFPTTPGAYDTTNPGGYDAYVVKLDASGSSLIYSTFLGGISFDIGAVITLDTVGAAVVGGWACSTNFPTTPGAFDTTHNGGQDAFVAKLDASGSTLLFSTFLGGSGLEGSYQIDLDAAGMIVVSGGSFSPNFPTTPGAYDTIHNGGYDAFVAKLDASGSTLLYSTFLGGSSDDSAFALDLDAAGAAVVGGRTTSSNFPTTLGAYDTTHNGSFDVFVTKLELELAPPASAISRNAGSNPASYSSNAPILGSTFTGTVDLASTGHAVAVLFGFDTPVTIVLPAGQVLLCQDQGGNGELLGTPASVGPIATFDIAVPSDTSLCGLSLSTQAVHIGFGVPFALSNARDLVVGAF
jgi:hypothetical protein